MQDAPLMLSVSGARGLVGKTMTTEVAHDFTRAFAAHLQSRLALGQRPRLVIGRDGRGSGAALAQAVRAGACASGFDVIDLGIVATPTVGLMIGHLGAVGGIVITASHNPIEWNGMKTLNADGLALPIADANDVIARFRGRPSGTTQPSGTSLDRVDGNQVHVERVLANIDVAAIRAKHFRVVLDSVNGGGAVAGRMLLEALGCEVVHLNAEHTGQFAHTPEPLEANLGQLMAAVEGGRSIAVGFAQDPDADRLALVDERGRFVGEEYTLALCALRLLQRHGCGVLATNLSTSRMIDTIAARFAGSVVVRTAVGEANVVAGLRPVAGIGGGEGNGGFIWPRICWVRDSLSAMALVLELLAHDGRAISAIAADIPHFAMVKQKMDLNAIGGSAAVPLALAKVREFFTANPHARIDATDGIRVDLAGGWVHLRASNTEPIIRVIAEAADLREANELCALCRRAAGMPELSQ
ncbi:MAG: phosphoglucosamine mutase [Phycisphaerales bacterium]|nr:phosphoglucosamine mutase [Phycisphaerales bacterium]